MISDDGARFQDCHCHILPKCEIIMQLKTTATSHKYPP
uniref:Uncharacterized protein n=1 Tax=Rhizophora mucronata TaxID=61149 RepID=A0A2P2R4T7_RHIMU